MEPDYQDGDILYLVDKGLTTYNGDLAVIAYGDRSYFKKIYTENGRLRLVSLNDKYEDIILDFPPAEDTPSRFLQLSECIERNKNHSWRIDGH